MASPASPRLYTITFEERSDYLYAYVEGEQDNYEISRAYWQEVADRAASVDAKRVMIHENILEPGTFAGVYRLASEIPAMGFGRARIAFVDPYIEQNEINSFGELVALNRGVKGKVFNDLQEAEDWLLDRR